MTSQQDIRTTINRGLAWVGIASAMVWFLDIVGMFIILALWISPEEMGTAAVAITLFPVLDLIGNMGLSAAVIQRDDHSEEKSDQTARRHRAATHGPLPGHVGRGDHDSP